MKSHLLEESRFSHIKSCYYFYFSFIRKNKSKKATIFFQHVFKIGAF